MINNFQPSLALLLQSEGGYSNHEFDHGGMTNLGVTKAVWEEYVGHPVSESDMRALTPEKVAPMYKIKYWNPSYCEVLAKGLDYAIFDFAVNAGAGRAVKTLQSAIGCIPDGVIGPRTMGELNNKDPKVLLESFSNAKVAFYKDIEIGRAHV